MKSVSVRFVYAALTSVMLCCCSEDATSSKSVDVGIEDLSSSFNQSSSSSNYKASSSSKMLASSSSLALYSSSLVESSSSFTILAENVPWNSNVTYGELKDTRDGRVYKTVVLVGREWMAENLSFDTLNNIGSWRLDQQNYTTFGRLYDHSTAKLACPVDWSLPKTSDWEALLAYYGITTDQREDVKMLAAKNGWINSNNSWDSLGFRALPGGYFFLDTFSESGLYGYWWSSDTNRPFVIRSDERSVLWSLSVIANGENGFSVRCIKQ